ncbi:MAG: hypothetical protein IKV34_02995 [Clostridia bacterium]|nr:hypothetical protein [Clostridia bacterium]
MSKSKSIKIYEYSHERVYDKSTTKYLSDFEFEKSSWKDKPGQKYDNLAKNEFDAYYHEIEKTWGEVAGKEQPDPSKVFYESQKNNIESMRASDNV